MNDGSETGQRRQRAIPPGEVDPQKSAWVDEILARYRVKPVKWPASMRGTNDKGVKDGNHRD